MTLIDIEILEMEVEGVLFWRFHVFGCFVVGTGSCFFAVMWGLWNQRVWGECHKQVWQCIHRIFLDGVVHFAKPKHGKSVSHLLQPGRLLKSSLNKPSKLRTTPPEINSKRPWFYQKNGFEDDPILYVSTMVPFQGGRAGKLRGFSQLRTWERSFTCVRPWWLVNVFSRAVQPMRRRWRRRSRRPLDGDFGWLEVRISGSLYGDFTLNGGLIREVSPKIPETIQV